MDREIRLNQLADAVLNMCVVELPELVHAALADGLTPVDVLAGGLSRGMRAVGAKFRDGEIFMPEVLVSCDTYYAGLKIVQPLIDASGSAVNKGKIVLGTIHGDVHTVGKDAWDAVTKMDQWAGEATR